MKRFISSAPASLVLSLAFATGSFGADLEKSDFLVQAERFVQRAAQPGPSAESVELRGTGKNPKGLPCEISLTVRSENEVPESVYLTIKQQVDQNWDTQTGEAGIYASDKSNFLKTFSFNENEINYKGVNKVDLDEVFGNGHHYPTLHMTFSAQVVINEKSAVQSARIREALFGTIGKTSVCIVQ